MKNKLKAVKEITCGRALLILSMLFFIGATAHGKTTKTDKTLNQFLLAQNYKAIPLSKLPTGHLYTEVSINEVKGIFILDTGAGATVVEEKRKEKFKMTSKVLDQKAVGVGAAQLPVQSSENNNLKINDYIINNYPIVTINLDHINIALASIGLQEIDGVIGADILTGGKAIIDYTNMVLYLK